jgi:phosphatidylglycerophosphate synthase
MDSHVAHNYRYQQGYHSCYRPNLFGKIASALQFVLIGLVLLLINFGNGFTIPRIFLIAIAVITAISGIYYIYQGLRAADIEST